MEAFIDGTFIRGEGQTLEEAEDAAWKAYQARVSCSGHEWEPRSYKNGAGFCKHCGTFGSKVFTGEQLGQFCEECNTATTYSWEKHEDGTYTFGCEEHVIHAANSALEKLFLSLAKEDEESAK